MLTGNKPFCPRSNCMHIVPLKGKIMIWLKLAVVIAAALAGSQGSPKHGDRDRRQRGYDCETKWHYKFTNYTTPQVKAIHDGIKLKICYRDAESRLASFYSCIDTQNFFEFVNYRPMQFARAAPLHGLIYDDNKTGGKNTGLSNRNVYPAIIAISDKDAYSSVDDNRSWLKFCEDCVGYTVENTLNPEIFKAKDGSFWASFNLNNRIVTTRDMRTWSFKANLAKAVQIHNIFPITTPTNEDKWVLVQIVNNVYNYYMYYRGTMTYEDGYLNEGVSYNLTYGADDLDLFFASSGDTVGTSQYALFTAVNTYIGFRDAPFRTPIILATPRKVMFREVRGVQRLYQVLAVDYFAIPQRYVYNFNDVMIVEGVVNPLNNIASTQFLITNMVFDLMDSKEVGIRIRKSADGREVTQIGYLIGDIFYVDRTKSGLPSGFPLNQPEKYRRRFDAREKPESLQKIQFQIVNDGCLLEVFCVDGLVNFNLVILPEKQSNRMEIITSRDNAKLVSFQIVGYD